MIYMGPSKADGEDTPSHPRRKHACEEEVTYTTFLYFEIMILQDVDEWSYQDLARPTGLPGGRRLLGMGNLIPEPLQSIVEGRVPCLQIVLRLGG